MRLTNIHGFPASIEQAVRGFQDDYQAGHGKRSDISVTSLISPPQIVQLRRQHSDEVTEDVSDRLYALMGQAMHEILRRSEPSAIVEKRLYADYAGWTLSGQFDRMSLCQTVLQDYKFCSVWEVIYGLKADREAQLNVLAQLAIDNGHAIQSLEVIALLRDWQASKVGEDNYPKAGLQRVPVPLWDEQKRKAYIAERIELHRSARSGNVPECSDEDRWYSGNTWAVMKGDNKRATKLFDNEAAANEMAATDKKFSVVFRPGENKRCATYCNVAPFCQQWKRITAP